MLKITRLKITHFKNNSSIRSRPKVKQWFGFQGKFQAIALKRDLTSYNIGSLHHINFSQDRLVHLISVEGALVEGVMETRLAL